MHTLPGEPGAHQPQRLLTIAVHWLPAPLLRGLLPLAARLARRRLRGTPPSAGRTEGPCFLDAYHGGIPFWDWIVVPGGLWRRFFWPGTIEPAIARARELGWPCALEIDGYTLAAMAAEAPADLAPLRAAAGQGLIEMLNGTFAQPFSQAIGGEANLRHFLEGLEAVEAGVGLPVTSYAAQEPSFFVQLPQLLRGFGYEQALLRTHWAPFGTEPAIDAEVVAWQGPDGTAIATVPRHSSMDYSRLLGDPLHPGIMAGGLAVSAQAAADPRAPLLSEIRDVADPPLPTAQLSRRRPVTLAAYVRERIGEAAPEPIRLTQDDLPLTLPWGLECDLLVRTQAGAERALLAAEHVDAWRWWRTGRSEEAGLRACWRDLLLAQHHDLLVCGPWLSRRHKAPMSAVGVELCRAVGERLEELELGAGGPQAPSPPPAGEVTVGAEGTLTVALDRNLGIDGGGFYTMLRDGRRWDSRSAPTRVTQLDADRWLVEGSVGGFPFQEMRRIGCGVEVEVTFDFGAGAWFGPQEPLPGYYDRHGDKLCVAFPTPLETVVRDTPFYYEPTRMESFSSLSWVGLEDGRGRGIALLSDGPSGYRYCREMRCLRRALAWAPRTWLYASDDSFSRNGSGHTVARGRHTFRYALRPYRQRPDAARAAAEWGVARPPWPNVTPSTVLLSAVFVRDGRLYARLWNAGEEAAVAHLDCGRPVRLQAVDLRLRKAAELGSGGVPLAPWGVQTVLIR